MAGLDDWSDHLSEEMRAAWSMLARVVGDLDGSLVGGTALAIHLRHRVSFDLDSMTLRPFIGRRIYDALARQTDDIDVALAEDDTMHATLCGVQVQVFTAPHRGDNPGLVRNIGSPTEIAGLPVASLADLLASKLDVILYRPKLRDYIDLKAIDISAPRTRTRPSNGQRTESRSAHSHQRAPTWARRPRRSRISARNTSAAEMRFTTPCG